MVAVIGHYSHRCITQLRRAYETQAGFVFSSWSRREKRTDIPFGSGLLTSTSLISSKKEEKNLQMVCLHPSKRQTGSAFYFAYSTARVSLITVIFICPG